MHPYQGSYENGRPVTAFRALGNPAQRTTQTSRRRRCIAQTLPENRTVGTPGFTDTDTVIGFRLSLGWFDSIEESHPLDDVAGFTGPVLAVTGSEDGVVPPEVSDVLLQTVASTDTTRHSIDGADHEFDATTDDQSHAREALTVTSDWLTAKLGAAPTS